MSEPALKSIFKPNYAQKLFIALRMVYSFCFGLRGNLDFPDFLQKKFYNINYRSKTLAKIFCYRYRFRGKVVYFLNIYRICSRQSKSEASNYPAPLAIPLPSYSVDPQNGGW